MNLIKGIFLFIIIQIVTCSPVFSQEKEAKSAFDAGNYFSALNKYLNLNLKNKNNPDYLLKIGLCYLNTNIDKSKAVPYLEEASSLPGVDPECFFNLGRAYHLTYKLDEAMDAFEKYKDHADSREHARANRQIEMCKNAVELIKNRLNVTFTNLGREINSPFPDYYPYIPTNEEFLLFTSRRKGNTGGTIEVDGYYNSDIYIAEAKNGEFVKAKNGGNILNTIYDEQASGLSPDGNSLLVYIDHVDYFGDLFISNKNKTFQAAINLGENINSPEFESSGSISTDGSIMIFSSSRTGGNGGRDIYITKRLPTGEWSLPKNLGTEINTPYNEEFPRIMDEGKTLYFASQGHNSMGGYDIFKSTWNEESANWTTPVNIGFPINTPEDNMNFSLSETGRYAYVSALRKEGLGDLDIYRVTFNTVDPKYTVYRGLIVSTDSNAIQTETFITVTDKSNDEPYGNYTISAAKRGKYLMSLAPGKYEVFVEADGFIPFTKMVHVLDHRAFVPEVEENITLLKIGEKPKSEVAKTPLKTKK